MTHQVTATLARNGKTWRVPASRVCFNVHQCFAVDDADSTALVRRLAAYLLGQEGLVLWNGPLLAPILAAVPELRSRVLGVITHESGQVTGEVAGIRACAADSLPEDAKTVFICETRAVARMEARASVPGQLAIVDAEILATIAPEAIPPRAWTAIEKNIYPIDVPKIRFISEPDMVLIDCPARNLALMPNGLAYVHNALKKTGIRFQTFDLDIVAYHRYHIRRLFDEAGKIVLPEGREMPTDPWQAEHYDVWAAPEVMAYFEPIIQEAAEALIVARPKILGLSIQQCSEAFSRKLVELVKAALPDVVVLVGGFSCYNADIGLKSFPEADYMCIGEADLTVGALVKRLARGERPKDLPGVLSRYDTPGRMFVPAPMPHNLDLIEFPKYEWCDLSVYRNYNGYQLVPVIASRGCRWSRCTFCAERFYWRIRSARDFCNEVEWLVDQGCTLFMFNESDLNGMPEKLLEICDEIIRRELKVRLTGQLRIQKTSDRAFFDKLHAAGFVALRFGVDAFSENTLRLQKKGYTPKMVSQNLRDCWEAGIFTEVNWVIGVPGETDADCEQGVDLILENRPYIGRLANINPLILVNGGVYWIDPQSHNIRFNEPREQLYEKFPRALPADSWYSVEPFIDANVRKARFERIVLRLHDAGFPVGPWAERVIEDVKLAKDHVRSGGSVDAANADQAPKLIRSLAAHNVVSYQGRYYALPHALGEVDIARTDVAALPGVITAESEAALLVEIDHAKAWANTRGQYDAQERQRIAGTLYRAGSALGEQNLGEQEQPTLVEAPLIVPFKGGFIALERDQLEPATATEPVQAAASSGPRTFLRRIADTMPLRISNELRSIWRSRRHSVPLKDGQPAPLNVMSSVAAGLFERYVLARRPPVQRGVEVSSTGVELLGVTTKDVQPSLLTTISSFNVVEYDGAFYGLPHGLAFDWDDPNAAANPNVIVAATAREVIATIKARTEPVQRDSGLDDVVERGSGPAGEISHVPVLLGSLEGYNLVSYEGFIYGMPMSLGPVDLMEVDAIGIEGVIRDVSRQVVENEINDLMASRQQAAE
jgi:radical SAM superfamily enzyme YgiQ (UPF0313 family)